VNNREKREKTLKSQKNRRYMTMQSDLLYKQECYEFMGACFEVYKEKGFGFVEPIYQECLERELHLQKLDFVAQPRVPLEYKGAKLNQCLIPDIVFKEKIIVELKAVTCLCDEHRAQVLNYMKATHMKLGLLVNFGHFPQLEWERLVLSKSNENLEADFLK
jgi:GxxExxY protein